MTAPELIVVSCLAAMGVILGVVIVRAWRETTPLDTRYYGDFEATCKAWVDSAPHNRGREVSILYYGDKWEASAYQWVKGTRQEAGDAVAFGATMSESLCEVVASMVDQEGRRP